MRIIEDVNQISSLCLDLAEVMDKKCQNLDDTNYKNFMELFYDWSESCDIAFNAKIIDVEDAIATEVQLTLQLKALARGYQLVEWFKFYPTKSRKNTRKRKQPAQNK